MTKPARKTTQLLADTQLRAIVGGAPSKYNQAETLASSIMKKRDDADQQVADKV